MDVLMFVFVMVVAAGAVLLTRALHRWIFSDASRPLRAQRRRKRGMRELDEIADILPSVHSVQRTRAGLWIDTATPIAIEPDVVQQHCASVIWLHGLGDTGEGWVPALTKQMRGRLQRLGVRTVLPTAPMRPVTLNGGMVMPAWYDIYGLSVDSDEDQGGVRRSAEYVRGLVEHEVNSRGIPPERICVGGFSQGGAVALFAALATLPYRVGAVVGLSCYLPLAAQFPEALSAAMTDTAASSGTTKPVRVLLCHGDADQLVKITWGHMTHQHVSSLANHCTDCTWKTYGGLAHGSCAEELSDVLDFLTEALDLKE